MIIALANLLLQPKASVSAADDSPRPSLDIAEVYRRVSPSVVSIEVEIGLFDDASGTGFVVDEHGHIVTNAHVVEDALDITVVFHDGAKASAVLIDMDTFLDAAVLKVNTAASRLKPVIFGDSDDLAIGQSVLAIGNPFGLEATLTTGIISGLKRELVFDDGSILEGMIQTDAAIAPGSSGGPLLNLLGEVIGVNSAGYGGRFGGTNFGFAIPSNTVRRIAEDMIANYQTRRLTPEPTLTAPPTFTPLGANLFVSPAATEAPPTPNPRPTSETDDADFDGMPDDQDKCPSEFGYADNEGCPYVDDADRDGIRDAFDACPNEFAPNSPRGCRDLDDDGLDTFQDDCPNEAGPSANRGCPLAGTPTDTPVPTDTPIPTDPPTEAPIQTLSPTDTPISTDTPVVLTPYWRYSKGISLNVIGVDSTDLTQVTINASVLDSSGQLVSGLDIDNFSVGGDLAGLAQVTGVENVTDDDLDFASVLVIDTSSSMADRPLTQAQAAARSYLEALSPDDPVAIVTFSNDARLVLDYTTDRERLIRAIDNLAYGGKTALYDATLLGIETAIEAPLPHKAVVLLSDGGEYGDISERSREDAIRAATIHGVPVYSIGLGWHIDRRFLEAIARESNAAFYDSPLPEELGDIYRNLTFLFRSQYIVSLNVDVPADGERYEFTLNVRTAEGQTASGRARLRAPIPVPLLFLPEDIFAEALREDTQITVEIRADQDIESIEYAVDGEVVSTEESYTIEPGTQLPGEYQLDIRVEDVEGDVGELSTEFEIAALPPRVSDDFET